MWPGGPSVPAPVEKRIFGKGSPLSTDILISSDPWENRVAILEDGSLAEIYIEREEKVIGSIYKGRVQNVLPGMGASFVDIGLGRNAFLYVDDIHKAPLNIGDVEITQGRSGWTINDKVNRGDDVLVQIVKEPRGLKGARISTNITLPGRYLILMPTGKYSGVSRKIESAEERTRLKNVMKRIRPDGMATVVRTAATGVSDAELIADLGVLIRMWHGILENFKTANTPALIHKDMNLVFKAARDFITPQVERVLVDTPEECERLRDFMRLLGPQYVDRISAYPQGRALFHDFKVDAEIARLMRPKVNLPSGGSLVIETTEALTVIDVNSGKFTGKTQEDTIIRTNLEAAAEIARQVRLRDIGGIIVCDFIDMQLEGSRTKVLQTLEQGLRRDRTRTTLQSFSALGLLEFTRKRVGKDLGGQLQAPCPTCHGLGDVLSPDSVAIEAFRQLRAASAHKHAHGGLSLIAPPTVAAQLRFWYDDEIQAFEQELNEKIQVVIDPQLHPEHTRVVHGLKPTIEHHHNSNAVPLRVGDEYEVEVLSARMPNPTSSAALLCGQIVEIENAQVTAGSTVSIRIIDIDGDDVLAELRNQPAALAANRKRRRPARGRKLTPLEQTEELRELAEEAARLLGSRTAVPVEPATPEAVAPIAPAPETGAESEELKRRRRRRRRRGGSGSGVGAAQPLIAPVEQDLAEETDEESELEPETNAPGQDPSSPQDPLRKRRRRRRRRRSNGAFTPLENAVSASEGSEIPAVPDRHIFRVDANGTTEVTGVIAPPEPSRALTKWNRRPGHVAVEPPPPSLAAPAPVAARIARPTRRHASPPPQPSAPVGELTATPPITALPPSGASEAAPAAPRKRGRPPKAAAVAATPIVVPAQAQSSEPLAAPAPRKRGRPPKAATAAPVPTASTPAVPAKAKPAAAPAKRTTTRKKTT